jgi:hypothetical protein
MMLKEFFEYFQETADHSTKQCWKFNQYETKFGNRQEIQFIGSAALLIELPDDKLAPALPHGPFEFLIIQTRETRIYKHAAYLLQLFADYTLREREKAGWTPTFDVKLHGNGFQAFVGVDCAKIEAINATGLVPRETMFGEMKEHQVTSIIGVRVSKKEAK